MTKNTNEVIIDRVDVSECKFFIKENKKCVPLLNKCKGTDCYYKQLQHEKKNAESYWTSWQSSLKLSQKNFELYIEQKIKNEELTEDYNELRQRHDGAFRNFERLKQRNDELLKISSNLNKKITKIGQIVNEVLDD